MTNGFTEGDIQLVATAVHRATSGCEVEHKGRASDEDEEVARAVLRVLAETGRLLPDGFTFRQTDLGEHIRVELHRNGRPVVWQTFHRAWFDRATEVDGG